MRPIASLGLFLALLSPAAAEDGSVLVGVWNGKLPYLEQSYGFAEDGRFVWVQVCNNGSKDVVYGRYTLEGSTLHLQQHYSKALYGGDYTIGNPQGEPWDVQMELDGDTFVAQGSAGMEPITFAKEPGSEEQVAEAIRASDAAKEAADAEWREKLAYAPLEGASEPFGGDTMVPADPKPENLLHDPTVYRSRQLFEYVNVTRQTVVTNDPGDGHDTLALWLLPNGRAYAKQILYPIQKDQPNGIPEEIHVQVSEEWGCYSIEGPDKIRVRGDGGTERVMDVTDGGRNVHWHEVHTVLTQIDWLTYELKARAPK
jgi:hypothetical protein